MKKLLFAVLFSMVAFAVVTDVSAFHRRGKVAVDMGDCPIPCCEKQELITVRKPAEMVCGWVCPDGTDEVEG